MINDFMVKNNATPVATYGVLIMSSLAVINVVLLVVEGIKLL